MNWNKLSSKLYSDLRHVQKGGNGLPNFVQSKAKVFSVSSLSEYAVYLYSECIRLNSLHTSAEIFQQPVKDSSGSALG